VEAIFQQIKGVDTAISGYMGGGIPRPTYKEVCSGLTGHVEVVQITFDPTVVSFERLLEVFWKTHDPTTPNRQGADEGTQYRSVVFYHTENQRDAAQKIKEALNKAHVFDAPLVTGIEEASTFYKAEDYHQNYFRENGGQPYCQAVVRPKVEKFEKLFRELLR
jgi:peptide-methionine (S)-S-oxide reductase